MDIKDNYLENYKNIPNVNRLNMIQFLLVKNPYIFICIQGPTDLFRGGYRSMIKFDNTADIREGEYLI